MQSKQDQKIEVSLGLFLIWLGKLFARFMKFLASDMLLGFKLLLGLAKKYKLSKSKLAKILYLASMIFGGFLLGITIYYIYMLGSNKTVSNNMFVASFFIFVFLLGLAMKIKFKISKRKIAKNIEFLNQNIRNRFESANILKDSFARFPLRTMISSKDKYFQEHTFYSELPLASWLKNKEMIEEILNQRIVSIKNDKNDTTMKIVETSKMPEPEYVKFEKKYLSNNPYTIYLGLDIFGRPKYINNKENPHVSFAGGSGTGKSTTAYSWFTQLKRHSCNKIILCDFKKTTFKSLVKYNNGKKCLTTKDEFKTMLKWAVDEDKRRVELFNNFEDCENLEEYNKLISKTEKKLKNIYIFIDELAVIMKDNKDKELESLIQHIAQCGRSQHIFLVIFTQRPSAKTIPSEARATIMNRLSGYQPDKNTSEMAIGSHEANEITPIKGRIIFKEGNEVFEVQMAHFKKEMLPEYLKEAI